MTAPIISGIYFDGQSARPQPVRIELFEDCIQFSSSLIESQTIPIRKLENIDFSQQQSIQIKFGHFPYENLVIEDAADVATFKDFYPEFSKTNIYNSVLKGNMFKIFWGGLAAMVSVVALYLVVVAPFIASRAVNLVPKSAEIVLGEKMTESLFATLDIDTAKSKQLNLFFEKVGFQSDYPIELFVSEEEVVNAFAVPGGKIVVFQGILDAFDSWEELAAVLAHELAHVEKRHSLQQMSRSLSTYVAISIMTSDLSGFTAVLVDNAFALKDLKNSRGMETEADMTGYQYLKDLSIDPQGMVDLFETLQKEEIGGIGGSISKAWSTHPLSQDRIDYLEAALETDANSERDYEERPDLADLFLSLQSGN